MSPEIVDMINIFPKLSLVTLKVEFPNTSLSFSRSLSLSSYPLLLLFIVNSEHIVFLDRLRIVLYQVLDRYIV